jgi:hypothetical protein
LPLPSNDRSVTARNHPGERKGFVRRFLKLCREHMDVEWI